MPPAGTERSCSRSRKGAWIEILRTIAEGVGTVGRSRKGAWIEINDGFNKYGAIDCRSRKGAWIEIDTEKLYTEIQAVAPVRERGLKLQILVLN